MSQADQQNKPQSVNIFNQNNQERKTFNIFAQKQNQPEKNNIFSLPSKSINLFNVSSVSGGTNIFKTQAKPLVKSLQDDQKSVSSSSKGNSQAGNPQDNFKSQPEKMVMKYEYQNKWTIIKTFNLKKFKNGLNPSKENIYLNFEKHGDQPEKIHIFVRNCTTKIVLFQGMGWKSLSNKATNFQQKDENIKITAIRIDKTQEEDKPKLIKQELKMQFFSGKEAQEFKIYVEEIFGQPKEARQETKQEQKKEQATDVQQNQSKGVEGQRKEQKEVNI